MKTYRDIQAEIEKLQALAEKLRDSERAEVIERIKPAIAAYNLTAADLGFASSPGGRSPRRDVDSASKSAGVAQYRDPETGKTWTGRGKPPAWIAGKDRAAFEIGAASKVSASAKRPRQALAGKRAVRTAGVPKYRNAETGQTWTGMGKRPAWIASAANRDDFLISPK